MTVKNQKDIKKLLANVVWDYSIPVNDAYNLIIGKHDKAGHFTRETFFLRIIESYPWFTVLKIYSPQQILELLSEKTITMIHHKSLKKNYAYIRKRLQQTLSVPA